MISINEVMQMGLDLVMEREKAVSELEAAKKQIEALQKENEELKKRLMVPQLEPVREPDKQPAKEIRPAPELKEVKK